MLYHDDMRKNLTYFHMILPAKGTNLPKCIKLTPHPESTPVTRRLPLFHPLFSVNFQHFTPSISARESVGITVDA